MVLLSSPLTAILAIAPLAANVRLSASMGTQNLQAESKD
jgi:hypothetical protein